MVRTSAKPRGKRAAAPVLPPPALDESTEGEPENPPTSPGSFDFSKPFQAFGRGQEKEFQRFTEEYPDRRAISTYVWRLEPAIDRKQVGIESTNIHIFPGACDLEALLERHGSGTYHLKFNDGNKNPSQRAKCSVKLDDPARPPNINPEELVIGGAKGRENENLISKYGGAGGSIVDRTNELLPGGFRALAKPAAVAPGAAAVAPAVAAAAVGGVDKALIDLARESMQSRAEQAGVDVDRALEIAKRMQAAPPPPDPVAQRFMTLAMDRAFSVPAAAPAADPLEHLERMTRIMSSMGWTAPGTAAPAAGGGAGWVDALTALPKILEHGAALVGNLFALRSLGGLPGQVAAPVAAAPGSVAPLVPAVAAAPDPITFEGEETKMKMSVLLQVGRLAKQSIESGQSGAAFAESLCQSSVFEQTFYDLVDAGQDGIMSYLAMVPGLGAQLEANRPAIEKWLGDFLSYEPVPEEVEPGGEVK